MTIFGENEDEEFKKKVSNYFSPGNYDDWFQCFKHLIKWSKLLIMHCILMLFLSNNRTCAIIGDIWKRRFWKIKRTCAIIRENTVYIFFVNCIHVKWRNKLSFIVIACQFIHIKYSCGVLKQWIFENDRTFCWSTSQPINQLASQSDILTSQTAAKFIDLRSRDFLSKWNEIGKHGGFTVEENLLKVSWFILT